jgi:hypothetical protein
MRSYNTFAKKAHIPVADQLRQKGRVGSSRHSKDRDAPKSIQQAELRDDCIVRSAQVIAGLHQLFGPSQRLQTRFTGFFERLRRCKSRQCEGRKIAELKVYTKLQGS